VFPHAGSDHRPVRAELEVGPARQLSDVAAEPG
jgi:hypothetical protein